MKSDSSHRLHPSHLKLETDNLKLVAIVAMDPDRVIGRGGSLPWHLPGDLAFFKRTTSGHPVVMGRRTWDSIGRPLPRRQNIVLTRDTAWSAEGAEVIHSPSGLGQLDLLHPEVFIIGGAQIYDLFLPRLDALIVTHIRTRHQGDTFFPPFEEILPHSELLEIHGQFEIRRYSRS